MKRLMYVASLVVFLAVAALLPVTPTSAQVNEDISMKNWRVFNINPDVPKLWDINQAQSLGTSGVEFTFNQLSSGWFTVYLNTNYGNLADKASITANASWTASTSYVSRTLVPADGAYFRIYFQSAQGNYNSNDYWWYTGSCDLNAVASSCTQTANLQDPTQWTNLCGHRADDTDLYPGPNCVGGTDPAISPADGFNNAKRNVKQVGLSFGRASRYASGVANDGTSASFQLYSYTVSP